MTAELLPCPFCGWVPFDVNDTKEGPFWVECPDCCAEGPVADTRDEAIRLWNTRKTNRGDKA